MSNIFLKIKKQKGYALLFAIIIIGSISAVVSGLLSSTTKQLILSSLAQDSLVAFYQADIAMDCGLYAVLNDHENLNNLSIGQEWSCGGVLPDNLIKNGTEDGFILTFSNQNNTNPCFEIHISGFNSASTTVSAKGYNICEKTNPRTVEREISAQLNQI